MERLSAITYVVGSVEYLARPGDRRRGGFNDWDVARRTLHARLPRTARVFDVIARREMTTALHLARIGAALSLFGRGRVRDRALADALLALSSLGLHTRHHNGTDGTDQVIFVSTLCSALARSVQRRPDLVDAVLWTVALQTTMAYGLSGWAKLAGPSWRSGSALAGVTRTRTYGDPRVWEMLASRPRTARLLGYAVLTMECLFPVVYAGGGRLVPAWLYAIGLFHLVNARVMGLGRFVTAFSSLHASVRYTSDARRRAVVGGDAEPSRDDTLPQVTGVLTAGALVGGLVAQARRRRRVLAGRAGEQRLRTAAGNELVLRRRGDQRGEGPVVVFEHGLLCTADFWHWSATALAERCEAVTYSRAGYGASRYARERRALRSRADWSLDEAVADLVDLVVHVGGGRRPVILAGHSVGGWIALRAAQRTPALVQGVALVDSSHPMEIQRSSRQAKGQEAITQNLVLMGPSLGLGLGPLLEPPDWLGLLPEAERGPLMDQYRDGRLWRSGLREWRAVSSDFEAFREGDLPQLGCPVLAITAGYTAALDPIQEELHGELAALGTSGRHVVIPKIDHERILFQRQAAESVAGYIAELAAQLDSAEEEERPAALTHDPG